MKVFLSRATPVATFLLSATLAVAQTDSLVYFFDENYNSCKKEELKYIGFGIKQNGVIKFTCFVGQTGILTTQGYFIDSTLAVKQGLFTYYDDSGYKISEGTYENNNEDGVWLGWHHGDLQFNDSSYYLNDSSYFENGDRVTQVSFNYHTNGIISSRYFSDYPKKIKDITTWGEDGQLRSKAFWINNTGDEKWFYPNGNIYSVSYSKKGQIISTKYYHEDGSEMTTKEFRAKEDKMKKELQQMQSTVQEAQPYFPGGAAGFRSYMEHHVQFPADFLKQLPLFD